jgi:D-serine dehydratase
VGDFMGNELILGKIIEQWIREFPLLKELINTNEVMWINEDYKKFEEVIKNITVKAEEIKEAEERLIRFSNYIKKVFPETEAMEGIIESPIISIN